MSQPLNAHGAECTFFEVRVFVVDEDEDHEPLGTWLGLASCERTARAHAMDLLWHPHLEAASCRAYCQVERAERYFACISSEVDEHSAQEMRWVFDRVTNTIAAAHVHTGNAWSALTPEQLREHPHFQELQRTFCKAPSWQFAQSYGELTDNMPSWAAHSMSAGG